MKKGKIVFAASIILMFSVFLIGCSSASTKSLEDAVENNKKITYSKQEIDMNIGVAGVGVDIKINGEMDTKDKKAVLKLTGKSSLMEGKDISTDVFLNSKEMYVKDPESDIYMKMQLAKEGNMLSSISSTVGESLFKALKDDKTLKESVTVKDDKDSTKSVTADISDEAMKSLLGKFLESEDVFKSMEEATKSQFIALAKAEEGLDKSDEEIEKIAAQEAKVAVEEYKAKLKEVKVQNVKYSGKIDKEGYLSSEEISLGIKEEPTGLTLTFKMNKKLSDINKGQKINIPEIPKEKIVEHS